MSVPPFSNPDVNLASVTDQGIVTFRAMLIQLAQRMPDADARRLIMTGRYCGGSLELGMLDRRGQ